MSALQQMLLAAWKAAGSSTDVDPYFSNVALLLHMDGSNGGTTFTDSSSAPKAVTASGNAVTSTTQKKWGTASGYFDGTGDYLTCTNAAMAMGTGDFTWEGWFYCTNLAAANNGLIDTRSGGTDTGLMLVITSASQIYVTGGSTQFIAPVSHGMSANTWYHIALCRVGSTLKLFIGGVQIATGTCSANLSNGNAVIGNTYNFGGGWNGYIDDFRITAGIARYTNNFSVPTAAFPTTGNAPYATWNPSDKGANITLSGGNLTMTSAGAGGARDTAGKSSGKWYWEVTQVANDGTNGMNVGVATSAASMTSTLGGDAFGWAYRSSGVKMNNSTQPAYGATFANGDTIGVALDLDRGELGFYKNNVFQGVAFTGLSGTIYPAISGTINPGVSATANFGQNPLKYTPPNGTFWNPKDTSGTPTFSNNNLSFAVTATSITCRANTSKSSGKYYFEVTAGSVYPFIGVAKTTASLATYLGGNVDGWGYYGGNGIVYNNGSGSTYATFAANDVIGVAVDLTAGKLFLSKNGVWQNSGDPVAGTGFIANNLSGSVAPAWGSNSSSFAASGTLNTGATPFAYSPPSGYSAWDATVYNAGVY